MHTGRDTHTHTHSFRAPMHVSYCPCQATDNFPYLAYHDSGCIPTVTKKAMCRIPVIEEPVLDIRLNCESAK